MLSEEDFEKAADTELQRLLRQIEALGLDLEAELQMGILSLEFEGGEKYIINSHRAAKQIWMAAARNAWHFDLEGSKWIAKKSGEELGPAIESVLAKKTGKPIRLA